MAAPPPGDFRFFSHWAFGFGPAVRIIVCESYRIDIARLRSGFQGAGGRERAPGLTAAPQRSASRDDLDSDSFILGKAWREVRYGEMLVCPLPPSGTNRNGS